MKVVRISQTKDREVWLLHRLGKITGSVAKKVKPLTRGTDRTPQGFWQLLAGKICIRPDGEPDMDRGRRLEKQAVAELAKATGLKFDDDAGMWESDTDEDIAVSPDGAEPGDTPTYAAEVKCLSSANHLKFVIRARSASKLPGYTPIDYVPNESKNAFREQVLQYFVVNEHLKTLYFVFYDDRIGIDHLVFHVLVIERADIADLIAAQYEQEKNVLDEVNALIAQLASETK